MTSVGLPPPPAGALAPSAHERRALAVGQAALGAAGLGAVVLVGRTAGLHLPACPFRLATGVPCPGCGMTRLGDALAHGHLDLALRADVAGVAFLVAMVALAVVEGVRLLRKGRPTPRWLGHRAIPVVMVALLLVHWATTIVTGGLPST